MPWAKMDDKFYLNPKVIQAGRDAKDLYIASMIFAAGALTDGFIPDNALRTLAAWAEIDNAKESAERLVSLGLWVSAVGGFHVHDWAKYNPPADQVKRQQEANAERQARWRANHPERNLGRYAQRNALHDALVTPPVTPAPYPYPSDIPLLRNGTASADATIAAPQESPKSKRVPKYSGEEQAYVRHLIEGVKSITQTKGPLPSEGKERQAAHWFYTADDGRPAPIDAVLECYRIAKAQPWRGGRYLSLQSLEADYVEYRRDPGAFRANSKPNQHKPWVRPTGTEGAPVFRKAEELDPWRD